MYNNVEQWICKYTGIYMNFHLGKWQMETASLQQERL